MGIYETLAQQFVQVVDDAAIACARTMGQGARHHSDDVAVDAMRKAMDAVRMRGTVVIGEGERDEAPMLFIGEIKTFADGNVTIAMKIGPVTASIDAATTRDAACSRRYPTRSK